MRSKDRAPFVRRDAPDEGGLRGRTREADPRRAHYMPFNDRAPFVRRDAPDEGGLRGRTREANPRRAHYMPFHNRAPFARRDAPDEGFARPHARPQGKDAPTPREDCAATSSARGVRQLLK